jgi:hypothetical protein
MSDRILKWWMSMADREGVGLNSEQLTTTDSSRQAGRRERG